MAAKLVVKLPKDVFASGKTDQLYQFDLGLSVLLGCLLKLGFGFIIPTGIMSFFAFDFQFGVFILLIKKGHWGVGWGIKQ